MVLARALRSVPNRLCFLLQSFEVRYPIVFRLRATLHFLTLSTKLL
jgi:hypothetical protein